MCCKITTNRRLRLRKRLPALTKLSTSISRLQKHRKSMKEAAIYNDRPARAKKFNALFRMGKI